MTVLNLEAIRAAQRAKARAVAVPEWGGDVLVRPLTAGQVQGMADAFAEGDRDLATNIEAAMRLVCAGTVNEDGTPMFASPDDLRDLDVGSIVGIATEVAKVSGISGDAQTGK